MAKCFKIIGVLTLLVISLDSLSAAAQTETALDISGIPLKVIDEHVAFKIQFIEVVLPNDQYAKDNLLKIWKYFCEKYPDKKIRLDLRVFTEETYQYNKQFAGLPMNMHTWEAIKPDGTKVKIRGFEAQLERKGDGVLAYGGDNEYLWYCPNLSKPDEKVRVVLAGK
jgi:hypothetical protein